MLFVSVAVLLKLCSFVAWYVCEVVDMDMVKSTLSNVWPVTAAGKSELVLKDSLVDAKIAGVSVCVDWGVRDVECGDSDWDEADWSGTSWDETVCGDESAGCDDNCDVIKVSDVCEVASDCTLLDRSGCVDA